MINFEALKAPFPAEQISWRVGSVSKNKDKALPFAYIDARDVMERLDAVCTPAGWQCKYSHANGKTVCDIGVLVTEGTPNIGMVLPNAPYRHEWIWKADGAGDSEMEAEKGALSDAFKRAAVRWGIGRYLYDIKAPWVAIDQFKHILPHEEERLLRLLPNGPKDGLRATQLTGQAKTPAKFWSDANLNVSVKYPKDCKDLLDVWAYDQIMKAINKAPTRDLLAKLQTDNDWIEKHVDADSIMESFSIRATQFDQLKGEVHG